MRLAHRNIRWETLVKGLGPGVIRHGLSDGRWSLIDLLTGVADAVGPATRLDLAVWTASGSHGERLREMLAAGRIAALRLMIDRSFVSRQPKTCAVVCDLFGEVSLRVWSCHAKFAIFTGGRFDVLVTTSANLNQNRRIENFGVWCDAEMCADYLELVDALWTAQAAGEGIADSGRASMLAVLGDREEPEPEPEPEPRRPRRCRCDACRAWEAKRKRRQYHRRKEAT